MRKIVFWVLRAFVAIASGVVTYVFLLKLGETWQIQSFGHFVSFLFEVAQCIISAFVGMVVFVILFSLALTDEADGTLESADDIVVTSAEDLHDFLSSHALVDQIYTKVAGVSYNNEDGTSRQDILRLCSTGDEIALRYFDYRGSPAYAVHTQYGQIGNLPANISDTINQQYSGCTIHGTIRFRTGGYDGLYFGCELLLKVYKENSSVVNSTLGTDISKPHDSPVYPVNEFTPSTPCTPFRVDEKFIAEAQWYAARGGVDLTEDD